MKTAFLIFLGLFICSISFSQNRAMTFLKAEKQGISITALDSIYPSALHSDSTKAVFGNKQQEFIQAYKKTLQDLAAFLKSNNFSWGKQTKCFNRIYFNKDGGIDYFLYNFGKDEITPEKQARFDGLLNRFIKDYRFTMKATTGFAQCSPVRYSD